MSKKDPLLDTDARLLYETEIAKDADVDLEPISSEEEDYESAPADYQISTYPADFTLEGLHQKWKAKEILIPTFQRSFVWKQVQASKLIESFLVGLPVPAVFFYTERKSQNYFVIDGQQRLKSVFYFLEGYFGEEEEGKRRVFKLGGLSPTSRFKDKRFDELREDDQKRLKNAVLPSTTTLLRIGTALHMLKARAQLSQTLRNFTKKAMWYLISLRKPCLNRPSDKMRPSNAIRRLTEAPLQQTS